MTGPIPLHASPALALGGWLAASLVIHVGIGGALTVAEMPTRASGDGARASTAAYEVAVEVAPSRGVVAAPSNATSATIPARAAPARERAAPRTRSRRGPAPMPTPTPLDASALSEAGSSLAAPVARAAGSPTTVSAAPPASERALAAARAWSRTVADRLRAHLAQHYPAFARDARIEGTVWLAITVEPDGRIGAVRVERSSGEPRLDAAAMTTVRALGRVTPPPAWLGTRLAPLRLPVVYRLR